MSLRRRQIVTDAVRRQRIEALMGQQAKVQAQATTLAAPPPHTPQQPAITIPAEEPTPPPKVGDLEADYYRPQLEEVDQEDPELSELSNNSRPVAPVALPSPPPHEPSRRPTILKEITPPMSFIPNLPTVVIVAADKGGVGKTTLSRVLLDYFKAQGLDTQAYDTEAPKGNLVRFHKEVTSVVNLRDSNDQIKVFDSITRSKVVLIDMRAGLLDETLDLLTDIGFFDLARQGKINLAFMHIIGSTIASFSEIESTADKLAGINHYIVLNRTSTAEFFKSIDSVGKDALQRGTATIEVPMLDPVATEHVEAASVPFGDFEKDPNYSFVMRGKVRTWEHKVFAQLDALKLNVH
jgi:hypothetical protein